MAQRSSSGVVHLIGLFVLIIMVVISAVALRAITRISDLEIRVDDQRHQIENLDIRVRNLEGK
jgi:hypothetical protein